MRIAIGGLHTECSTYNPLLQTADDFARYFGQDVIEKLQLTVPQDVTAFGLSYVSSVPGGPIAASTYDAFKADFLQRLKECLPVDAVYLAMHGAVHVAGSQPAMEDAEGDWLKSVRDLVGPDCIIATSFDLHGNITQQVIDQIDIFSAFRTAPHIDVAQTHMRAFTMSIDALRTGNVPFVTWAPVPVLMPGERSSTDDSPARELYALLPLEDAKDGILDANLMVGYVWADTPRATACAVVTGTDEAAAFESATRLATAYWTARSEFAFGVTSEPLKDCLQLILAEQSHPVILADSGDNPTGGGVGDRADVLESLLQQGISGAVIAGITDAPAAYACRDAGVGALLTIQIGAALGQGGPRLTVDASVVQIIDTEDGKGTEVLINVSGNLVIVTARRRPFHNFEDFRKFGIEPAEQSLIVVKSGYLSPDLAPIANPALMALTDGAVNQDMAQLENTKRGDQVYPFQADFSWSPTPKLSKRRLAALTRN